MRTAQLEAARIKGEADSLHGQAKELGHREGFEEGLGSGTTGCGEGNEAGCGAGGAERDRLPAQRNSSR